MNTILLIGLFVPFLGTTLGAACVYMIQNEIPPLSWLQQVYGHF